MESVRSECVYCRQQLSSEVMHPVCACGCGWCSQECRKHDTCHSLFSCYVPKPLQPNQVDVVDVAATFCEALSKFSLPDPSYELVRVAEDPHKNFYWQIRDSAPLKWTSFSPRKALNNNIKKDRHLRYAVYHKAKYAGLTDMLAFDLMRLLLQIQKAGKELVLFGDPVSLRYAVVDMKQTCFGFDNPLLLRKGKQVCSPLLALPDMIHTVVTLVTGKGSFVLDVGMAVYDVYTFRQRDSIFLAPATVLGPTAQFHEAVYRDLKAIRNHLAVQTTEELDSVRRQQFTYVLRNYQ